ncbi:MAG TPA: hypothetical protein VM118_02950, partial [Acidobacteriota bacterium]|nr:hypothetical protein [Acidobacteriota bacterium]
YKFGGLCTVPLTAWDVSVDPPRQLNVCFVEKFQFASDDETWLPANEEDDPDQDGGREYLFILNSDYSEVENEYYTSRSIYFDGFDFDILYIWWPLVADGHSNVELADGQVLSIDVNRYNTPEDEFGFRTTGAQEPAAAGVSLADVHPVPSPWFHGHNVLTGGRCEGISFVNLPQGRATVEIYSLAGELIATAQKADVKDAAILWDVRTSHGLPPASGLYVYRVIVPGIGDKIGKLAVFMEEERLKDF